MNEYKKEVNTIIRKVAGAGGTLLNEFLDDLLTTGEYEENLLTIDNSITVPINQPDLFGAIEAPITPVTNNITIPFTDFKWNQISELQLPNGKKVFILVVFFYMKLPRIYIFR